VSGANDEQKLGGLSMDGSSAAENRFIIDGIDTTNAVVGLPLQSLNVDNVEEIQIKSSGYSAEFGGSTGGVVNVVTKSGTNGWRGDVRFYVEGDWLDAGPRPTLRRNPQVSTQAEYVTYPEDPYNALAPGFSLGGRSRPTAPGSTQPTSRSSSVRNARSPSRSTAPRERSTRTSRATC
jgi:outer membrane receptor protein involved in Fe transport